MQNKAVNALQDFVRQESASGIILIAAMLLAMLLANSPFDPQYEWILHLTIAVQVGALEIHKPLLMWVNDGLMAVFFLLVGLEVKREVLEGQLSSVSQVALPGFAALGGIVIPALIYYFFNHGDAFALRGWAIPTATDIAFALGILSLAGSRVPVAVKLVLMTLAIMDDLGAIVIIAAFYTSNLSWLSLGIAAVSVAGLAVMNLAGVVRQAAYVVVGVILWVSVLKSGVHATLAGVALAFAIPLRAKDGEGKSPLRDMEHSLHPWVTFLILPLFAFANAGVPLANVSVAEVLGPVPMGIALGLFLGKQIGIFGFIWLSVQLGLARLPPDVTWLGVYGMSILGGIGFTMSLFIDSLAFEMAPDRFASADRLAVLLASVASAVIGYLVLRYGRIAKVG
jgi:NhaA family Na+:H+ antiporter